MYTDYTVIYTRTDDTIHTTNVNITQHNVFEDVRDIIARRLGISFDEIDVLAVIKFDRQVHSHLLSRLPIRVAHTITASDDTRSDGSRPVPDLGPAWA